MRKCNDSIKWTPCPQMPSEQLSKQLLKAVEPLIDESTLQGMKLFPSRTINEICVGLLNANADPSYTFALHHGIWDYHLNLRGHYAIRNQKGKQ